MRLTYAEEMCTARCATHELDGLEAGDDEETFCTNDRLKDSRTPCKFIAFVVVPFSLN